MPKKISLEGLRFGRLVVLSEAETKGGHSAWICLCDCGVKTLPIRSDALRNGLTKSCGCLLREAVRKNGENNRTHGMSHEKLHGVWAGMKARCNNPNTKYYEHYGGRGIKVCTEWERNFQSFYDHVSILPHCGEQGYSLDRIDNNGDYKPGNVRWATAMEQQNNKRTNISKR